MASTTITLTDKQALFVQIRKDLEKQAKANKIDILALTEKWLKVDGVVLGTVGQVVSAARIFEVVPFDTPSPWSVIKQEADSGMEDLMALSVAELRKRAKTEGVKNVTKLKKADLVKALTA